MSVCGSRSGSLHTRGSRTKTWVSIYTCVCIAWSRACVYDCVSTVGTGCNCCLSTLLSHIFSNVGVHVLLFCMIRCGIYTYGLHPLYKYVASVSGIARSLLLAGYLLYASCFVCALHEIAWHERDEHGAFGRARAWPGLASLRYATGFSVSLVQLWSLWHCTS